MARDAGDSHPPPSYIGFPVPCHGCKAGCVAVVGLLIGCFLVILVETCGPWAAPASTPAVVTPKPPSTAAGVRTGPPALRFVQFQGPPGLSRDRHGQWHHTTPLFCQALLTAAYHGVDLTVIGPPAARWGRTVGPLFGSKASRVHGFADFLETVADGMIVFFIDAMDTLILKGASAIRRGLSQLPIDTHIIFSGERNCYPLGSCRTHPELPTSFQFVNAGGLVGRAGPVMREFARAWRLCTMDGHDDQKCANWLYADFAPARRYRPRRLPIALDYRCHVFQSAWGTRLESGPKHGKRLDVEGNRTWIVDGALVNPETGTAPALLHFNGWKYFMGYYFLQLFPAALSWDERRVANATFRVWGASVRGSDLCIPNVTYRPAYWPTGLPYPPPQSNLTV